MSKPSLFGDDRTGESVKAALRTHECFADLKDFAHQDGDFINISQSIDAPHWWHLQELGARAGDHLLVRRRNIRMKQADILAIVKAALPTLKEGHLQIALQLAATILNLENATWDHTRKELVATYTHHGIVLPFGEIAHFTSQDGDQVFSKSSSTFMRTPYAAFIGNSETGDVQVVKYDRAHHRSVSSDLAILLVEQHQTLAKYNALSFNCEHFATIIRNGEFSREQVQQLEERIAELAKKTAQTVRHGVEVAVDATARAFDAVGTMIHENPEASLALAGLAGAVFLASR